MELTVEQALQKAVEAHKVGRLQDAKALYQAILQAQPKHPDSNHNLGVLAVSVNKPEAALPLFKTALEANPNEGQFWISYIDALIKARQLENAKNVLEQGKKLGLAGERVDALEAQLTPIAVVEKSESILQKQPSSFTQQRMGVSAKIEKKKNSSSNQTNPNQVRSPSQVEVNGLLEHYQKGRFDLAENLAKTITQKYPDHQFGWKVLGALFQQTGRLQKSLIAKQRAVEISPNDTEALYNLGNTLKELGRLEDAEVSYNKAIAIKPQYAEAHYNLGSTLKKLGRLEAAEASYRKAIAIKPEYAEAHSNLGNTLKELGRIEEAEASYRKAIAIKPEYAEAHKNLSLLVHYQKDDPQIAQVMKLLTSSNLTTKNHVALHFAAGKMCEDTNQIALAFEHYSKGNRFRKTLTPYDIQQGRSLFDQIKGAFALAPSSRPLTNKKSTTKHPVFIVGMPRSGTSLVEQILASHSMLHGAGELNLLAKGVQQAQCLPNVSHGAGHILRATYLAGIEELGVAEPYISDKMPLNFRWIGFILDALPEAKIIHTRRHPLATIWSIFKTNFTSDGNAYANSLEDLVAYYQLYEDLMGFWHAKFPGQIYDIQYETLTKNQEAESRKLLKFVGLDWEEQCLAFHETKRAVATASAAQVRKPMYQGSSKEWERFKEYLLPLADVLLEADSNRSKKLIPDAE